MRRIIAATLAAVAICVGALAPQAAVASTRPQTTQAVSVGAQSVASSTGQYEYICIGADGSSWSLRIGEPTTDCHGSFLHKYINGTMVANYKLSVTGAIIDHPQANGIACLLVLVGGIYGVLQTDGSLLWISALGWDGLGTIMSCLA